MCYDTNAKPPDAPGDRGSASGQDIELLSGDGTRFMAYDAVPGGDARPRAAVAIYPDVRGLHGFYKELALRFAEKGIRAVAIDYFARTAGTNERDDSFEYMPHVQQLQLPSVLSDMRAALDHIDLETSGQSAKFVLGFCMGGALSLITGTQDLPLDGAVAFYAGLGRNFAGGTGTALEQASKVRVPVLGLFGGADQGIPTSMVEDLDRKLDQAGVEHEIVSYPGAPHSFFDRKYNDFAQESKDAWERVLAFIEAHSKQN